ncbi:MAG: proliferating cell nuclear antigen (pcna) [Promethearchaeota archaeon]|nr:MAG: proliferating cell nuclear antigen (pcna) [Candidatus Lokiarchaeota archaeon]
MKGEKEMAKKKPDQVKGFTLKKENSKILKTIVETLASIIDEAKFQITPKEFMVEAMDPSRICLLRLTIKNGDFDEYQCAEKCHVGLNLDDLDKILKRSTANDSIEISLTETDQKIKVKMKAPESTRTRTFSLALLDVDIEEIPMENLLNIEFNSDWVMDPEFLVEAIKDAEIYSEILNMKALEDQGLVFSSTGQIGEMNYELEMDDLTESNINDTASGAYSLTFLKAILKIASITERLKISIKSDHPLKMVFDLLEGGNLHYFLAPRVDSDDDEDLYDEDDIYDEEIEEEEQK